MEAKHDVYGALTIMGPINKASHALPFAFECIILGAHILDERGWLGSHVLVEHSQQLIAAIWSQLLGRLYSSRKGSG